MQNASPIANLQEAVDKKGPTGVGNVLLPELWWTELRDFYSVEAFRALHLPLFHALVAYPLGLEKGERVFGPGFRVIPSQYAPAGFPGVQVNLHVPSSANSGIWEPVRGPFRSEQSYFTLVDFFDWAPLRLIDLQYYVVMIDKLDAHQDRVGQHALVEVAHGDVVWDPDRSGSRA